MRIFVALILSAFAVSAFAGEAPTPAEPQSVVVAKESYDSCSDCYIRRRGLFGRRGYVVVQNTITDDSVSTTRQVIDGCCNTVRSTTVTKNKCNCK
jgi:hypothetical protein